jgi:type VI secretion system protein ImpC
MNVQRQDLILAIATLNAKITEQLLLIIEAPALKALFSQWFSIKLLVTAKEKDQQIHIRMLNVNDTELKKDVGKNSDIESSKLFHKIYEEELGTAGGTPFSVILYQDYFDLQNIKEVHFLKKMAEIGLVSLCPIVTQVAPQTFSEDDFKSPIVFHRFFKEAGFETYNQFRQNSASRFIALTLPRVEYYHPTFIFQKSYLWTIHLTAGTFLMLKMLESFKITSWFSEGVGFFHFTPEDYFCTETFLPQMAEESLSAQGIIGLFQSHQNKLPYFSQLCTAHIHFDLASLLLEHLLAACRFAHYIKIIARDKIGSHVDEKECELFISKFLAKYTNTNTKSGSQLKEQYPLKGYQVSITKTPGKAGSYHCNIILEPHMKLENMTAKIALTSEIIDYSQS